jgi:ribonuclease H / adenosylcobalamin/alpha-ribazole phosphatase
VRQVVVEADGGARGNPGPSGFGAVVRDPESGEVLAERFGFLGMATNNVAEYSGLIAGLSAAVELGAREVAVRMDSKLVIEQMSGRWQIKHAGLRPLAAQAAALVREFDTVRFDWIPRERNRLADALANRAMDEGVSAGGAAAPGGPTGGPAGGSRGGPAGGDAVPKDEAPRPSWEHTAPPMRLILVRHGETELTASGRYSGRGDVALSERGQAQAKAVAARVAGLAPSVVAVLTSPLSRCTATARFIADAVGQPPVIVEADLVECDFGEWEGLTFEEVRRRWPYELDRWLGSAAIGPPGGESFRAVADRVRRLVTRIRVRYPGQTVVVVSHVSPIKVLLRDVLNAGDVILHRLHLDPAGLSIVDSWQDGGVAVRTVNDTAHLVR